MLTTKLTDQISRISVVLPNQSFQLPPIVACSYSNQPPNTLLESDDVLAVVGFGHHSAPTGRSRHFNTGLPVLGKPLSEVWRSHSAVEHGIDDHCYWSANDELMFLGLWINESHYPDLKTAVFESYTTLLQTLRERNYPHLLRVWNYLPRINHGNNDSERYKQFCLGRHEAFNRYQQHHYPAATAIGHSGGDIVIYLIAARHAGPQHFENPRQMSAFCYPREYGPKSPSFARASMLQSHGERQLYISGTASIHGHQSRHPGNFHGQVGVTCENIATLLQHVASQLRLTATPSLELIKVYLRNPQNLAAAETAIEQYFGPEVPALFLQGDICRQELLVEIDGMCRF
ncbi:MAG: hypothetical protein L3J88_03730 [Gammaproteobacteria bacterium]|nr:hypothetical protein [Gammaproteobacteria bacterium]MCF6362459.1 hypothetical protein [Gammaproteobacteria bacterium]